MFKFLRKKFSESIEKLSKKVVEKEISEKEIDNFFSEVEIDLLRANVALEVLDNLKLNLKEKLVGKKIQRGKAKKFIENAFKESLLEIIDQGKINFIEIINNKKKIGKPACFVFLGFNGSGKTTTLAKLAKYLIDKGFKPVFAAADTFRAASIEQLEEHAKKLGVKVIKHKYGADPAAVVFDAIKHAENSGKDVVLVDTAGRSHADKNLMDELKKIIRVNNPDLKILVIDSLAGNDVCPQAKTFNEAVGVDGIILTKIDVNEKGGSAISAPFSIKKPILFIGTGQNYEDFKEFNPKEFLEKIIQI